MLSVVQSFIYLGVLYDSNLGPMSALEYRDDKGWKVLGALKNSLHMVPFLPFARVAEMGEAMVGGTFLYSAELWAPYLDLRRARVPRAYAAWLHGFGKKARADRLVGWVPARDLDIKAETAVVRMLADESSAARFPRGPRRRGGAQWMQEPTQTHESSAARFPRGPGRASRSPASRRRPLRSLRSLRRPDSDRAAANPAVRAAASSRW